MIKINTEEKEEYVYELNGEEKKMDFPDMFQFAEYVKKSKADALDAVIYAKELLLGLGMDELAIKHLKAKDIKQLFTELAKGDLGN